MSSLLTNRICVFAVRRCYSTDAGKNVAFIGLGNMGKHMASNLIKKGFKVRGYDASAESLQAAAAAGVETCASVAECVRSTRYVVSALPNNEIVRKVYLDEDGVVANASSGTLLIDSSTVEPTVSVEVATAAKNKQLSFLDAPMSGGVMGAQNGTLAFMVGGTAEDVTKAEPLLSAMGARHTHCGPVGSGEVAKLCNNLLMAITMMGTAECMNLGIRMGLEPAALLQVINGSSGRSWCSEVYCPVPDLLPNAPSSAGYAGGFKTDLLVKDLTLAGNISSASGSASPLGALAAQLYRLVRARGHGNKDFSYIYQFLKS